MREIKRGSGWEEKKRTLDAYGHWPDCPYCEVPFNISTGQVDHIVPTSIKRNNKLSNKLLVCESCNSKKQATSLLIFLKERKINPERVYWRLKADKKEIPQDMLEYLRFPE